MARNLNKTITLHIKPNHWIMERTHPKLQFLIGWKNASVSEPALQKVVPQQRGAEQKRHGGHKADCRRNVDEPGEIEPDFR